MNQKRMIFAMMGFLHCFMYSMEKLNEIPDNEALNDYFKYGEKWIPKKYQNDAILENFTFCVITKNYIIDRQWLQEKFDSYSCFPSFETTRSHSYIWRFHGGHNPYRFKKVTTDDLAFLDEINKAAIGKNN